MQRRWWYCNCLLGRYHRTMSLQGCHSPLAAGTRRSLSRHPCAIPRWSQSSLVTGHLSSSKRRIAALVLVPLCSEWSFIIRRVCVENFFLSLVVVFVVVVVDVNDIFPGNEDTEAGSIFQNSFSILPFVLISVLNTSSTSFKKQILRCNEKIAKLLEHYSFIKKLLYILHYIYMYTYIIRYCLKIIYLYLFSRNIKKYIIII